MNGIFQAVGDSRHPLYFLIISAMLNVALDLLFVGVLGMGVGGAAFATVISQAVSAFLGLRKLMKATESYRLIPRKSVSTGECSKRCCTSAFRRGCKTP